MRNWVQNNDKNDNLQACILIHKFTDGFRKKDTSSSGMIQISYEDFLQMVLTGC